MQVQPYTDDDWQQVAKLFNAVFADRTQRLYRKAGYSYCYVTTKQISKQLI